MDYLGRAAELVQFVRRGHVAETLNYLRDKINTEVVDVGLSRDLREPFKPAPAAVPIEIRPIRPGDNLSFLELGDDSADLAYTKLSISRLLKLRTGYVAIAPGGGICYLQWLIIPSENHALQHKLGNLFPTLAPDEALLEGAYTVPAYRGKGIMSYAMAQIAEKALDFGIRRVITFVEIGNVPSLKGCERAGFYPYTKRIRSWQMLNRKITYEPIDSSGS